MASDDTGSVIQRFHDALNAHDVDAVVAMLTDDVIFEDTTPPDGVRHIGPAAMAESMRQMFADAPSAHFDIEEMITAGDRGVVRWHYQWGDGHVRGIDLIRVRDGRIAESIAYVKG